MSTTLVPRLSNIARQSIASTYAYALSRYSEQLVRELISDLDECDEAQLLDTLAKLPNVYCPDGSPMHLVHRIEAVCFVAGNRNVAEVTQ